MRQDFQIIRHLISKQTTLILEYVTLISIGFFGDPVLGSISMILEGVEKLIKLYPNVMSLRFNNAEPIDIIFQILEHYRYLLIN